MTTSALALAAGSAAEAVEWEVAVGGYFETYAAYSSPAVSGLVNEDFSGVDNKMDAEIHFLPAIRLDNGLQIGADVQLEAAGDPDTIDESYLFVDGDFGRVLLGAADSAGYLMHYGAPDVTFVNVNSGSMTAFVPFSGTVSGTLANTGMVGSLQVGADVFYGTLGSTYLENGATSEAQRFTYFTPRFAGFQFGVSYARDGLEDDNTQLNLDDDPLHDIVDIGANYVNAVGAVDVAVSGRWGLAFDSRPSVPGTDIGENPQVWGAGLNLGYMGFTVGGSFAEQNNTDVQDGRAWDAGIAYETGPWGLSFTYFNGENVNDEFEVVLDGGGTILSRGNDETLRQYLLGASYDLAEGVALNAFGAYVDFDEETGDPGGPNVSTGDDVDGWVVGTGIKISF